MSLLFSGVADAEPEGFSYYLSDEQLARLATATIEQRLEWLESTQQWTWDNASPEVRADWARLRRRAR